MFKAATTSTNILLIFKTRIFSFSHQITQSSIICRLLRQMICVDTVFNRENFVFDSTVHATWFFLLSFKAFTFLNSRQSKRENLRAEFFHNDSIVSFIHKFQRRAKSTIQDFHWAILHVAIAKFNNDDLFQLFSSFNRNSFKRFKKINSLEIMFQLRSIDFFQLFWSWNDCLKDLWKLDLD